MKVKDQPLDTMVRHRHTLSDALYNSIRHIKGVGKCSDYTENGLVALVKQIALEKNTLDPPPKEMQKTVLPPKPTNKKVSKSSSQTRPQATNQSTASSHTTSLLGQGSTYTHSKGHGYHGASPKPNNPAYKSTTSQPQHSPQTLLKCQTLYS